MTEAGRKLAGLLADIRACRICAKDLAHGVRPVIHAGFDARIEMYDFFSSPLAGLFPGWRTGYQAARAIDGAILRVGALRRLGSNFEVIARLKSDGSPSLQAGARAQ